MPSNERLRGALASAQMTIQQFSAELEVDPKTVERWINGGRIPHRRHRLNAAARLGKPDHYLWEGTGDDQKARAASQAELVEFFSSRGGVGSEVWLDLLGAATASVDLHAYAATFLHDSVPGFAELLANRAQAGVSVRLLFGDPESSAVARRGTEEGIGDLLAARCGMTWRYFDGVMAVEGVQARRHGVTLYASMFRFDQHLLVNPHAFGAPASHSPVFHLARIPGGRLFDHYVASFDRIWASASTYESGEC